MVTSVQGIGMTSQRARDRMVNELRQMGIKNQDVLRVISNTPRHLFMDEALSSRAYENCSLPIGQGQTISQPYIVAKMTEILLQIPNPQKILEIGTGSGYQTAVLSPLVRAVYSIERIEYLLNRTKPLFRKLKLNNILAKHGDGYQGWPSKAPFDAIIITAAPQQIPNLLFEQLADGGRLISPVGEQGEQQLWVYQKIGNDIESQMIEAVSFVPLLNGKG